MFQHTATRRWLDTHNVRADKAGRVSTHSHPKVAGPAIIEYDPVSDVSTHSHPKVAGRRSFVTAIWKRGFNTQPPEGGW